MKRNLVFIKANIKEKGFIFPYILFLAALCLLVVTSSTSIYKNHIQMTTMQMEQIKLDTLIQISHAQFKEELQNNTLIQGQKKYNYPYGSVIISYSFLDQGSLLLNYKANTDKKALYEFSTILYRD